jgi:predicted RNase H-like nuclease
MLRSCQLGDFVGVDGCRGGWFAVWITEAGVWSHRTFESIDLLFGQLGDASHILIDMQIGLVDEGTQGRRCEAEGRKLLGSARRSSIFVSPSRLSLAASTYGEASRINQEMTGRKLSKQTWWIMPKIREVDELMDARPEARNRLFEVNIELLFWALNESRPMKHYKKTARGFSERMQLLNHWFPQSTDLYEDALGSYLRKDVSRDDIVDALSAAVSSFVTKGELQEIPVERQIDSKGLPMRMVVPRFPGA